MNTVKEYKLDFCTIQARSDNIAIIEINDGVEVNGKMADELAGLADKFMAGSFGILSNRIHSYSLSFEAMSALAKHDNMAALAIVVHSSKSRMLVEAQNFLISALKKKPIKIFMDFDSAISWLQTTLQDVKKDA